MNTTRHTANATISAAAQLPRRPRLAAAIASLLVSATLFNGVVLCMTSLGDHAGTATLAGAHAVSAA